MLAPQCCFVIGFALVSSVAFAQDVSNLPGLPLVIIGCPREYEIELPISLRIEVNALTQERAQASPPSLRQIAVTCSEPARAHIDVVLVQGRSASINLDQTSIAPEARTRALALSTVELVNDLWTSDNAPQPATRPSSSLRAPKPAPPRASPRRYGSVSLGPVVERTGRPGAWLFGGELEGEWPIARFVTPMGQLRGQFGLAGSDFMPVRVVSWSAAAYAMIGTGTEQWRWGIGPGARAGIALLTGDANGNSQLRGDRLTAPWAGFGMRAAVSHTVGVGPLRFSLATDVGVITLGAAGTLDDNHRVYALEGAWFAVTMLVGAEL